MTHTPGPWHIREIKEPLHALRIQDDENRDVVACCYFNGRNKQIWDNAQLIAAVPDLLEALERVLKDIDYGEEEAAIAEGYTIPYETQDLIKQAIAKAIGETP